MEAEITELSGCTFGAAIEVHKALGPGLLESAYEECMCRELAPEGIGFDRQVRLPIEYKGISYRNGNELLV